MKLVLPALLLAACCLAGNLSAQQAPPDEFSPEKSTAGPGDPSQGKIKYVLIMPEEKVAVDVKMTERNPFGKTNEEVLAVTGVSKGTTEENSIRERLEKLKIVGISPTSKGTRVMLGNMVLEAGELVPPVVPDQTLNLRVGRITDHAIELVWIEKKPTGMPPRLLTLPLDMHRYVRYALLGQTPEKSGEKDKPVPKGGGLAIGTQATPVPQPGETAAKISAETRQEKGPAALDAIPAPTEAATADATITVKAPADVEPAAKTPNLEPDGWKRAVGYLNNLVKLEEGKK